MRFFSLGILFAMLLAYSPLHAQEDTLRKTEEMEQVDQTIDEAISYLDRNFNFGVKAGLNFSTFNDDQFFRADMRTRLHLGVFTRLRLTQRLSAKAELLYSMKGARADQFSIFEEYAVDLNYLTLPVMAEFALTENVLLEIGPYIGVLLNSKQSFQNLNDNLERFDTESDQTNFVDVGLGGGITYTADSGVGVGIRYTQGLADALGDDFFRNASGANSVTQVSAYYTF
ncbi:MAG: porin family protein [Cyclobacteriaceae bacterium]